MPTRTVFNRSTARRSVGALILAAAAFAAMPLGSARAEFPDHPVTIVACFPPGGGTDVAMRLINTQLGQALGQPVIVENRAGAGGSLGTAFVARAAADGYTLLGCSSAFVVNPSLYASVNYDPIRDFSPVMVLGSSPNVFVVPGQSKIKTMGELIAAAKANPGKLNWTSPGLGTTPQLAGELLKIAAGIDMLHIPFTGAAPATTAALAGQVDMYAANLGSVTGVLDRMRPLAVTAEKRWPDLPDVPTIHEAGIAMPDTDTFQAIFAPAGTPQPVVDRLAKELAAILARPDVREKFARIGLPVVAEGPNIFRARIDVEVPMYKEVIDKAGLKVQ
ncbi:MAG TPA: tripartite tricarboxylate transporter substrate-binding protein [Xanthobacteraceae bacterium]|nr:tripartite tricarboxylate transporter substrate-binding protein [Xanthobacteraceae bacterium]